MQSHNRMLARSTVAVLRFFSRCPFIAIEIKVHNGDKIYSPSVRIYCLDLNAAFLTSMHVR